VTRHTRGGRHLTVARRARDSPLARQRLARPLLDACRRHSMAAVAHRLGRQVAFMQALCAVLARRFAVLVDTFGLALATTDASAAGTKGCRSHDRRHGRCRLLGSRTGAAENKTRPLREQWWPTRGTETRPKGRTRNRVRSRGCAEVKKTRRGRCSTKEVDDEMMRREAGHKSRGCGGCERRSRTGGREREEAEDRTGE
jgi:hypothetical protein